MTTDLSDGSQASVVLDLLADALRHSAGIYNQGAISKVLVEGPSPSRPPRLSLTIKSIGYRFEETAEGHVTVLELGAGTSRPWARLEPQSDTAGQVVCWRESRLQDAGAAILHTSHGVSEEYLLNLIRRKLASAV